MQSLRQKVHFGQQKRTAAAFLEHSQQMRQTMDLS